LQAAIFKANSKIEMSQFRQMVAKNVLGVSTTGSSQPLKKS